MPRSVSGRGACQEIVMDTPSLAKLPILQCWPADGGRFITLPMVITKDPLTGIRNVGMYRMQVMNDTTTGMHWHKHKTGARHFAEYKRLGKRMPVAVALGGHPANTFAATAPLPDNIDEFMLSGFLQKRKVELVKCLTNELEVPADADFIIEGYVDPQEELLWEGPFGDHTGFYSLPDFYPAFHVTCITHRREAVYPATIVGVPPMEDAYIAKATERIFLAPIKLAMVPEMTDMNMPYAGVAHNLALVSFAKTFPGQAAKVTNALWGVGQMMFNKMLITVDSSVDVHNYWAVAKAVSENMHVATDVSFSRGPLDVLDHAASHLAYGGKLFIDATVKLSEEQSKASVGITNIPSNADLQALLPNAQFNTSLLTHNISCLLVAIHKTEAQQLRSAAEALCSSPLCAGIKIIVFVDEMVPLNDFHAVAWVTLNNMDAWRDNFIVAARQANETAHLIIDGTRKRIDIDRFERDWPNAVVMNEETIAAVDARWDAYQLGSLQDSPSRYYRALAFDNTAYAEKRDSKSL